MIHFQNKSMLSGCINVMAFDMEAKQFDESYMAWQNGKLIQDAFPSLNVAEREFLMTGITPDEWNSFELYEEMSVSQDLLKHYM